MPFANEAFECSSLILVDISKILCYSSLGFSVDAPISTHLTLLFLLNVSRSILNADGRIGQR